MSVLERGEVEALLRLEKDLVQGLGVSQQYTAELTKAISRVAGIGCNVVGTFTITTTQGDPAVGPCVHVEARRRRLEHRVCAQICGEVPFQQVKKQVRRKLCYLVRG